ncbi:MAG TPA: hypothetical protein PLS53_08515, partial [Thermoanaerobaculaceae bacterium]|nr:hypothetical protein [Thermoanaerobaculaceae bacterium]
ELRCNPEHTENVRVLETFQHILDSRPEELFEAVVSAAAQGATIGEFTKTLRAGDGPRPKVVPVRIHRGAEPFESLREQVMGWRRQQGDTPQVFVAAVGTLAELAPRLDFTRGFFQVAGFAVKADETFPSASEATEAARTSGAPIVVVLSTDDRYPEVVPAVVPVLKAARPEVVLVLAGFPKEQVETFKQAGIDEFIHVRSDVHATLAALARRIGVMS